MGVTEAICDYLLIMSMYTKYMVASFNSIPHSGRNKSPNCDLAHRVVCQAFGRSEYLWGHEHGGRDSNVTENWRLSHRLSTLPRSAQCVGAYLHDLGIYPVDGTQP